VLLVWVAAFKLEVSDGLVSYRSLFGGVRRLRLDSIESADTRIDFANSFGPIYRLTIRPTRTVESKPIVINMKVFALSDLHRFMYILGPKLVGRRRVSMFGQK